ncbi:MAG TPA: hypothetical protein VN635_09630 [Conexibacter sp.]|nr:hypothetical protein [Conexibacter sp.]
MQTPPTSHEPNPQPASPINLREIVAEAQVELARLEAAIAHAEVRRLEEQLAWERAWRRRGLFGRVF